MEASPSLPFAACDADGYAFLDLSCGIDAQMSVAAFETLCNSWAGFDHDRHLLVSFACVEKPSGHVSISFWSVSFQP